jgi:hypothetical protein
MIVMSSISKELFLGTEKAVVVHSFVSVWLSKPVTHSFVPRTGSLTVLAVAICTIFADSGRPCGVSQRAYHHKASKYQS